MKKYIALFTLFIVLYFINQYRLSRASLEVNTSKYPLYIVKDISDSIEELKIKNLQGKNKLTISLLILLKKKGQIQLFPSCLLNGTCHNNVITFENYNYTFYTKKDTWVCYAWPNKINNRFGNKTYTVSNLFDVHYNLSRNFLGAKKPNYHSAVNIDKENLKLKDDWHSY